MAAKDIAGGLASLFLLFAKIILCLMFALYDRLADQLGPRTRSVAGPDRPPPAALERS